MSDLPQLLMRRSHLQGLPEIVLPDGYWLRHFFPGDERGWNKLLDASFGRGPGYFDFNKMMVLDEAYQPERVWFILSDAGEFAATASSWLDCRFGVDSSTLHWVGSHPNHGLRRLGRWVSIAALRQARSEGKVRSCLFTDDERTAALKTYLRLDFAPVCWHESHPERWRVLLERLSWPQRFEEILSAPLEPFGYE
ncbi:MAG: hypothetical protein VX733_08165 [Candidatus Latescibacterota bacterium]|nr:hypothetical protein [Candidatus Latescibacterota bacterium]